MSTIKFFQTAMGKKYIEGTMPRIAAALEAIAEKLPVPAPAASKAPPLHRRAAVTKFDDEDGQPSLKGIMESIEYAPERGIPGILFPIDHSGEAVSEDGRVFICKDDAANIFRSDVDAANFVSCLIGRPWRKFYDQPPAKYYYPYFELQLEEVNALHQMFADITKHLWTRKPADWIVKQSTSGVLP